MRFALPVDRWEQTDGESEQPEGHHSHGQRKIPMLVTNENCTTVLRSRIARSKAMAHPVSKDFWDKEYSGDKWNFAVTRRVTASIRTSQRHVQTEHLDLGCGSGNNT